LGLPACAPQRSDFYTNDSGSSDGHPQVTDGPKKAGRSIQAAAGRTRT
jgi:hypothetical protein